MTEKEFYLKIVEMAKMPTPNQQKYKDLLVAFQETLLKFQDIPQAYRYEALCCCAALALAMNVQV